MKNEKVNSLHQTSIMTDEGLEARPASSGNATFSEHKDIQDFDAHLWPVPSSPRHRERVYISMIDL
jgi:hypothetical protein